MPASISSHGELRVCGLVIPHTQWNMQGAFNYGWPADNHANMLFVTACCPERGYATVTMLLTSCTGLELNAYAAIL